MGLAVTKLEALGKAVQGLLQKPGRYFNPEYVKDVFERYDGIRDSLRALAPAEFSDLPVRPRLTPVPSTDFEGKGYVEKGTIELLARDIDYAVAIAKARASASKAGTVEGGVVVDVEGILKRVAVLRHELGEIAQSGYESGNFGLAFERAERWKTRASKFLHDSVSPMEGKRIATAETGSFTLGDPGGNFQETMELYDNILAALESEIRSDPSVIATAGAVAPRAQAAERDRQDPRRVFIIHGHDDANTLRLEKLLSDEFKLSPVVLRDQAGMGRTLIAKFEAEAAHCSYAFALVTPDDQIEGEEGQYTQARPNVAFEIGWFFGRLGSSRVAILLKDGARLHSDLNGVSVVPFRDRINERVLEIRKELTAAGVLA